LEYLVDESKVQMKRVYIISGIIVLVSVLALVVFNRLASEKKTAALYTEVIKGDFEIAITTAGELKAENSVDIKGPEIAQRGDVRSMDIRIQDLVPEGTEVKEGDYIAQLDRSNFDNTLKDILERLGEMQKELDMKILDTAVTLSAYRDEIQNQRYVVEADSITLKNSVYESPNIIRQAEINYDQSKRTLGQRQKRYELNVAYAKFNIDIQRLRISRFTRRKNDYEDILASFTIKAPSSGMVIYKRDWRGNKRKTGSSINPFDRVVATLPDLSSMMSRIYVTEIDISKMKVGQKANIVIDAFPKNTFNGVVKSVANIGEKLPNTDSKVFEVLIKINGTDPLLRPSMTTGNKIVIETFKDVTYVPMECVQAEEDSIPFVYTRNKTKQIVLLGKSNEKYVIIEQGLEHRESIYLATPENPEKFRLTGNDLTPIIKERDRVRKAENQKYGALAVPVKEE
jgi:multidrug efflux pump subunit AcrA (membrane-fusion protein)